MSTALARIPVVLNRRAGTAAAWREAVAADRRFALDEVEPGDVLAAVRRALDAGATRIAAAGGDGTLVTAATAIADHPGAELAVLPGGTLNHFAAHLGIPTDPSAALDVAASGRVARVDVAWVGGRLFLNTSTVGAYVTFVRLRERLERRLPYGLASLVAGLVLFLRLPSYDVELEVDGRPRRYHTPLLFVGVGERELDAPDLARRVARGRPGLHVLVVRGRRRARLLAIALAAARGGPREVAALRDVDSFVVDRCRVGVGRRAARLSTDGELLRLPAPLDYRADRGRLAVVVPPGPAEAPAAGRG